MVAGVAQPFQGPLDVGADKLRALLDVFVLDDQTAAIDIEAGVLHEYPLELHPTFDAARSATSSLEARNMTIKSAFFVAKAAGWIGAAVS